MLFFRPVISSSLSNDAVALRRLPICLLQVVPQQEYLPPVGRLACFCLNQYVVGIDMYVWSCLLLSTPPP